MYQSNHWLYLNIAEQGLNSFLPAWAAYRGVLATPNQALGPEVRRTRLGLTPHLVRLFRNKDSIALQKELAIESVRRAKFPAAISRLSCIYCWQDEATARLAPKFWANQGRHFDVRYLVEVGVSAAKAPTIVDTRWIDRFVINSREPLQKLGLSWIEEYWRGSRYPWNGESDIPKEPLLECLVDGTAMIYGTNLRMEAYPLVEKLAPEAVGILEKSRLGVDLCTRFDATEEWRFGQIVPFLMTDQARKTLWLRNLINLDEKLVGSINRKVPLVGIKAEEINSKALKVFEKDEIRLPDLRILDVDLSWLSEQPVLLAQVQALLTAFFHEGGGDVEAARRLQQEHDQLRLANKLPTTGPHP